MIDNKNLALIEGVFSHEDALEIILTLFSQKINFHKIKNWSFNERYGKNDEDSLHRIQQLEKEIVKFKQILSEEKYKDKKVFINSEIKLSFSDIGVLHDEKHVLKT